jgi:hypothetical protein
MLEHNEENIDFIIEDWFYDFPNEDVQHIKARMRRLAQEQYELGYNQGAEDQREMFK